MEQKFLCINYSPVKPKIWHTNNYSHYGITGHNYIQCVVTWGKVGLLQGLGDVVEIRKWSQKWSYTYTKIRKVILLLRPDLSVKTKITKMENEHFLRKYVLIYCDNDLIKTYRLDREDILFVTELIRNRIQSPTAHTNALTAELKMVIMLPFLATRKKKIICFIVRLLL